MTKEKFPLVRLQPAAHQYLSEIAEVYKEAGRQKSMTAIVSEAVLSLPMPIINANGHTPPADPCPGEEKPNATNS